MGATDEDWPVFWCSLLGPVLLGEIPERQRERYFQELSQQEHLLPNGQRKRISARTLRRQWQRFRAEGVQGLFRRRRSDRGKSRRDRESLLARAVELKKEQPYRSDEAINRILRAELGRTIPRSTLYRHLRQAGATRLKLGVSQTKVRCRWTRDRPNALWVGDFEHGPHVMHQGRSVKTHLSAWIDCHSRYIVEARYYVRENLDILIDSLLRAWGCHGASRELYVDNAKIYHANALKLACAQLNIKLLHRPPRDPPAGGLIERLFQTAQMQFEAEVRATDILTLDRLNELFVAWLGVAYHEHLHSETGQAPAQRYQQEPRWVRRVNLSEVLTFFHHREQRTVDRTHADVRIDNLFFAVDPKLRGDRVIVQYDPFGSGEEVLLYSLADEYLGRGRRYQRQKGSHPSPPPTVTPGPIEPLYLQYLEQEHRRTQEQRRRQGIDYQSARQGNVWSLPGFAAKLARLLGRKGGASALSTAEMEALAAFHARHDTVTEARLQQAFEQAESKTIPAILFHLQQLLDERNP